MMWLVVITSACFLLFLFFRPQSSRCKAPLPPSPPTVPLLGCLPWLRGRPLAESIEEFRAGQDDDCPLLRLPLANRTAVYVNDAALARKVFVEMANESSDRPFLPLFTIANRHRLGIVAAPTHRWIANRRTSLRILREFGLGKTRIVDGLLAGEVASLRTRLDAKAGQPISPAPLCNRAVGGVICALLFGSSLDFDGDAAWFDRLLRDSNIYLGGQYLLMLFFPDLSILYTIPLLWRLLPDSKGVESAFRIAAFMRKSVAEVRANLRRQGSAHEPSNFVEAFLAEGDSPSEAGCAEDEAARLLMEFFVAGVDTTSTTLQWALSLMCAYPKVQERAHKEVTALLGPHGAVENRHSADLPFCKALVHEVLRFGCIAAVSIPHTVQRDIELEVDGGRSFLLPEGCYLHLNIFALARSPKYWSRPYAFDPEANFMDAEGKAFLLRHPDAFLPFSLGRRACLGESLARNEAFVLLTSILQSHRVRFADSAAEADPEKFLRGAAGPVRWPVPTDVIFERYE